jgi:hypothetical protein
MEDRAVDGLVKRLRRKLEEDAIATVRGVGYALLTHGPAAPQRATVPQPTVEICVRSYPARALDLQPMVVFDLPDATMSGCTTEEL